LANQPQTEGELEATPRHSGKGLTGDGWRRGNSGEAGGGEGGLTGDGLQPEDRV
jgi:hypothetical protein